MIGDRSESLGPFRDRAASPLQPGSQLAAQYCSKPGTILTMTLPIFTALSVTQEIERGTMVMP
jgi:hypothetical protein